MAIATVFDTDAKTIAETRKANPENFAPIIQGRQIREPLRYLYIHSTAKRSFGPIYNALLPHLILRACGPTEPVTLCAIVPDPITQWSPDMERGGHRPDEHDAWNVVTDMLNPGGASENCNLIARGVFPSWNKVPTPKEVADAAARRDARYKMLTDKAIQLEATNPRGLNEYLQEEPDVHHAMDAQGLEAAWHRKQEVRATCPNCGDSIKQGIAFHQSSAGVLCVVDPEKAFRAGAITRERYEDLVTDPGTTPAKSRKS